MLVSAEEGVEIYAVIRIDTDFHQILFGLTWLRLVPGNEH